MAAQQDLRTEFSQYIRERDFKALFQRCSELETRQQSGVVLDASFYVNYLFACLFTGGLVQAKFLWKRLPNEFRTEGEIGSVWAVCKAVLKRKYSEVYQHLDNGRWRTSQELSLLFREQFSERMTNLVTKAYSSIKINQAAAILGLLPSDVSAFAVRKGWTISGDVIHPKLQGTGADKEVKAEELERITKMLNFLEQREHAF